MHDIQDIIHIFNQNFLKTHQTRLVKGGDEPIYLPLSSEREYHEIHFAHGYFSSALHECAHWLIAGKKRRQLEDFGYWYNPDGRTAKEQALFETVEVKPQSMEWILAEACGYTFRVSLDNLNGELTDTRAFKQAILKQVLEYCTHGLPLRAKRFRQALAQFYQRSECLKFDRFELEFPNI